MESGNFTEKNLQFCVFLRTYLFIKKNLIFLNFITEKFKQFRWFV